MGTLEQNKALVMTFMDALREGRVADAAACFDLNKYYSHAYEADLAGTWEQQKEEFRNRPWTDVVTDTTALVAEGDLVVHVGTFTGTHTGEFLGHAPTGKRIPSQSLQMWRIEDDKIVEHWGGIILTPHFEARLRGERDD